MDHAAIPAQLNIEEALSRIRFQNAETRKFVAEQNKLAAEAGSSGSTSGWRLLPPLRP